MGSGGKAAAYASKQKVNSLLDEGCRRLHLSTAEKPPYHQVIRDIESEHRIKLNYDTLRRRFLGISKPYRHAHASQQLLSPEQERVLCQWIIHYSETANPLSKRTLLNRARSLCGKKPSVGWMRSFLQRWPSIKLGRPSGLDPKRAQAFNRPVVAHHCELLDAIIKKHEIPAENVYNMDEKGCQLGGGRKLAAEKYFVPRSRRPKYRMHSDNLELVTIIECVSADGTPLLPGFVFSGKSFCPEWFEVNDDICIGVSENGWTDDFLGSEWFQKSFIPQATARNSSNRPMLLILDGHGSHETVKIIDLAISHGVILFCLPPHTTHKLQALDVGVFGPFSRAFATRCDEILELDPRGLTREDFVQEYMAIRSKTFKATTIQEAFRKSSSWPVNFNIFTDDDFAPSYSTSTTYGHVPPTYPQSGAPSVPAPVPDGGADSRNVQVQASNEDSDEDDDVSPPAPNSDDDDSDEEVDDSPSTQMAHDVTPVADPFNILSSINPLVDSCKPRPSSNVLPSQSTTLSPDSMGCDPQPSVPKSHYLATSRARHPSTSQQLVDLEQRVATLEAQLAMSQAHCTLARQEIEILKRKTTATEAAPRKRAKVQTFARCVTSSEGRRQAQEQERARAAKLQKKSDMQNRRTVQEAQRQLSRLARGADFAFVGSLTSKNKPDLQDIADELGIGSAGTKVQILERLNAHFAEHPGKRLEHRFKGLFPSRRGQPSDENPALGPVEPSHPPASTSTAACVPIPGPSSLIANRSALSNTTRYNSTTQYYPSNYPPHQFY